MKTGAKEIRWPANSQQAKTCLGGDVNKHPPDSTLLHPLPQFAWSLLTIQDVASLGSMMEAHLLVCSVLRAGDCLHSGWTAALEPRETSHQVYNCLEDMETTVKGSPLLTKAFSCREHSPGYFPPRSNILTQTFTGCLMLPSEAINWMLSSQI